ncbi:MCE family protein [Saccharopolyspora sp. TS4A08]|uniref:MCE family protein n=1 Tax=Saccharopolyspora ipomoeae TaxID=3042027 RepID=A0ABT6PH10_9PSEU|nr:MCE family protein [Saccharopolyspora sp. TS4A08]MDI2027150.1 MCE family protein [Saccharopolyspora sp. TS4A08]
MNSRYVLIGAGFAVFVALLAVLSVAQYQRAFDRVVPITVLADRSGLLMEPGSPVKLRGVEVGSVGEVTSDGTGARVAVELDPEQAERIPAEVTANLVPSTVFGAKYVELRPGRDTGEHIAAGAVLDRTRVNVELDHTFDHVMDTLRGVPPSKLNAALTSVSGSLQGNGERIRALIADTDGYLRAFNPNLPELESRLPQVTAVAEHYRDVTDDLTATASNLGGTGGTLVEQERAFAGFLLSLTELGNGTGEFLEANGDPLVSALDESEPTTGLLQRYSPVVPCFFGGVVHNGDIIRAVTGGPEFGGTHPNTHVTVSMLPGIPAYQHPQDLPKTGVDTGPDCHGLPEVRGIPPYVNYDTGANPYPGTDETVRVNPELLAVYLFGPLTPLGGGR